MSDSEEDQYLDATIQQRIFCSNLDAGEHVLPCVELPLLISRIALRVEAKSKVKLGTLITVDIQRDGDDEEAARLCNFRVGTVEQCDVSLALHPMDGDVTFIVSGKIGVTLLGEQLVGVDMDEENEEEVEGGAAQLQTELGQDEDEDDSGDSDSGDSDRGETMTRAQLVAMLRAQGHAEDDESDEDEEEESSSEGEERAAAAAAEAAATARAQAKASKKRAATEEAAAKKKKKAKKAKKEAEEDSTRAPSGTTLKGYSKGASGLLYKDEVVGGGPLPKKGRQVQVHYKGWLQSGEVFDQTTGKPFKFRLGLSQVIRGWDLGIASMRVGGRRTIICPPHLAYGNKSPGAPIPANATLTFEVELVKAK